MLRILKENVIYVTNIKKQFVMCKNKIALCFGAKLSMEFTDWG